MLPERSGGRARWLVAVVLAGVIAGSGCVPAPDGHVPAEPEPASVSEQARAVTVRVRNTTCAGLELGSGVVLGDGLIATNRHVVEGAQRVELTDANGRDIAANIVAVSTTDDLAVIRTDIDLPGIEQREGRVKDGEALWIAGWPGGERLVVVRGRAEGYGDGKVFGGTRPVLRAAAEIEPGNSGGPVLDAKGQLVGVVFGKGQTTDLAYIVAAGGLEQAAREVEQPAGTRCV